jgi:large subunit ribosomal protein L7/L12
MTLDTIVQDLSNLKVSDLVTLTRRLEDEWGVSANAITQVTNNVIVDERPAEVEVQTEFTVRLKEFGHKKIEVIKVVREVRPELSLVEAKEVVESAPTDVVIDVARDKADDVAERLQAAGATVEIN